MACTRCNNNTIHAKQTIHCIIKCMTKYKIHHRIQDFWKGKGLNQGSILWGLQAGTKGVWGHAPQDKFKKIDAKILQFRDITTYYTTLKIRFSSWKGYSRLRQSHNFYILSQSIKKNKLQSLLQQYSTMFNAETGKFQGAEAKIAVDPAVPPKFCRVRTIPHALKPKVEMELKRLQQTNVIKPI